MAGVAAGAIVMGASAAWAQSKPITVEPQPLMSALHDFGSQTGAQILYAPEILNTKVSTGVTGAGDEQTALATILAGTGLTFRRESNAYVIVRQGEGGSGPPAAGAEDVSAVDALIVTARKREENIQDVPIAISAFSQEALEAQKIEGGFDLLKAIPNVTFSKNNFTSYNFSIRGVGTKAVSATTDPGVAVAFNNSTIIQNRLFEQEYFDVERVEVLRGPQGTLYGRNATSGVINVISAKPDLNDFEGFLKGEVGNYDTKRVSAMVNVPLIEDKLAIRLAGALTSRQGYDYNTVTKNAVNGRELWSGRVTVGFEPTERLRGNLIWERFEEDDDRSRTGKQLCHRDDGPTMMGDEPLTSSDPETATMLRSVFAQGCKGGNLYEDAAFGTPNGLSLGFVYGMLAMRNSLNIGRDENGQRQAPIRFGDPYGGMMQSRDLREIASLHDPVYRASADLLELNLDFDLTDSLTLVSQTTYVEDETYSFQDYNRFNTVPIFTDTSQLTPTATGDYSDLAPGGVFCDPQLGCSNTMAGFDIARASAKQFNQEFRLQSDFDGPVNFSLGANYTSFEALADYYVMYNVITAYAMTQPFNSAMNGFSRDICYQSGFLGGGPAVPSSDPNSFCPYIDPNPVESMDGEGHNYFRSKNPYEMESTAVFGELYWEMNDQLKITAGLRYTEDVKTFTPVPSQVLLAPGLLAGGYVSKGYPAKPDLVQEWNEWTGRVGVDWKPELGFTDDTMLYAFYSRGYKGGGANPPSPGFAEPEDMIEHGHFTAEEAAMFGYADFYPFLYLTAAEYGPTFEPEFVNAFEVGAKNTLLNGALTFNATGFYYDYTDYQVSQIRDRTAVNENFDTTIWGLEFETVFSPTRDLQIIANLGYLDTKVADGESSIDIMNRTQGDSGYTVVKPWAQIPSNCVIPTHVAAERVRTRGTENYFLMCGGWKLSNTYPALDPEYGNAVYDPANYPELNGGAGLLADLSGNELPNAPHWTANLGGQYGMDVLDGTWRATIRGDVYWQSQSYHRIYNWEPYDKLRGWYNANLSIWIERPDDGLKIELYAKNIFDDTPITDAFLNSDDTALTTNVFTLDPRLIGLSIRKEF